MLDERHRVPRTKVCIDYFRPGRPPWVSAYFLTHYHADHYGGLTHKWRDARIYCSPTTARLLLEYHCLEQRELVHPVPMGEKYAIEEESQCGLTVTLLDANHCPGSVLILFELGTTGQRFLHTGDMRYSPTMKMYRELTEGGQLDALYLDTTYCNKKYQFPRQREAIATIVQTAQEELAKSDNPIDADREGEGGNVLFLVATYLIGKERVLEAISRSLERKVYINETKDRVLRLLQLPYHNDVFTGDAVDTNVHVTQWEAFIESVPWGFKPNFEKMQEILQRENVRARGSPGEPDRYQRVVGFVPTGWTYDVQGVMCTYEKGNCKIYGVPYSEHSSFRELHEWVGFLHPVKVVPTVGGGTMTKKAAILACFKGLVDEKKARSNFCQMIQKGSKRKLTQDGTEPHDKGEDRDGHDLMHRGEMDDVSTAKKDAKGDTALDTSAKEKSPDVVLFDETDSADKSCVNTAVYAMKTQKQSLDPPVRLKWSGASAAKNSITRTTVDHALSSVSTKKRKSNSSSTLLQQSSIFTFFKTAGSQK